MKEFAFKDRKGQSPWLRPLHLRQTEEADSVRAVISKPLPDFSNINLTIMMFWPNNRTTGWAELDIRLRFDREDDEFTFINEYVSWLDDTFGQLVDALIAMCEGKTEASAFASMEPQRTEFKFRRQSDAEKTISLSVLEWSPYREEGNHLVWDYTTVWNEIGTAHGLPLKYLLDDVIWIGNELKTRFGEERYQQVWGFPLPVVKLEKLCGLRASERG